MGKENLEVINRLYGNPETNPSGFNPIRDTLKGFATGKPGEVFEAPFGGDYEAYIGMVKNELRVLVPKAIDRFMAEVDN